MHNLLIYMIESGICLLVFYLLYQVFLKKETYYRLNRAYLLFALSLSQLAPLLNISIAAGSSSQLMAYRIEPVVIGSLSPVNTELPGWTTGQYITLVYWMVQAMLLIRLLFNLSRILKIYRMGSIREEKPFRLVLHPLDYPPFSFFRNIFISRNHYSGSAMEEIIEHEKAHVRQFHSLDILLAELLIIFQWFNPLVWIYKKIVTENHEFLADESVIHRGYSPESYQLRIIAQLFGIRSMPATHNFNQSIVQKRLKMMEKPKSSSIRKLKLLLVLPAALALFYVFACSSSESDLTAQEKPEPTGESLVYLNPDVAAEPAGGLMEYRRHLARHMIYPEEAKQQGVQGKIYIQFVIDEHGKVIPNVIGNGKIAEPPPLKAGEAIPATSSDEGIVVIGFKTADGAEPVDYTEQQKQWLIDEAIRVIRLPYEWTPAMKDGKAVRTQWTVPIQFLLK
jgi:beta-lactamase regulating signal transducer with metallopeptidase domain